MPLAELNVGSFSANALSRVEQVGRYSKYNVWFALNQVRQIKMAQTYSMLYGSIAWKPNMGPTMAGVRIEPTPIARAEFRPNPLQIMPLVDVYEQGENREETAISWHDIRSRQLYFLGNFQDFFENQVMAVTKDLENQTAYMTDLYLRTFMWDRAPNVYIAGADSPLVAAPNSGGVTPSLTAARGAAKSAGWVAPLLATADTQGLKLETIQHASITLQEDLGAVGFSGGTNEYMQEKYMLITSTEAASQWIWGPAFTRLRNVNKDYLSNNIQGDLFDNIAVKYERFPMRFDGNGNLVAPQVWIPNGIPDATDPLLKGTTGPNPAYSDPAQAPWEISWLLGGDAYKSIKIGPPPKAFAGGKTSANRLSGMEWNGKITLRDDILIKDSAGNLDFNTDKRFLQLRGTATFGAIAGRAANALPILFHRARVSTLV